MYIKFCDSDTKYEDVVLTVVDSHTVQLEGCAQNLSGFKVYNDSDVAFGDYSKFTNDYGETLGSLIFKYTDDGHTYVDPTYVINFKTDSVGATLVDQPVTQSISNYSDLKIPTVKTNTDYTFKKWSPSIPTSGKPSGNQVFYALLTYNHEETLDEARLDKVTEMNVAQQATIQDGVSVTLSDGTVETFTLTEKDQTSLLGLKAQVMAGEEKIPWHTHDTTVPCKYYSNADMAKICDAATLFVTYHVTYFRDLRIYINVGCTSIEEVKAIGYGIPIPDAYKSEVLKDLETKMSASA